LVISCVLWCNLGASQKELFKHYAKQLEADGMFHKAANIYLSIHHVYDAINVLTNNSLFKYVSNSYWEFSKLSYEICRNCCLSRTECWCLCEVDSL